MTQTPVQPTDPDTAPRLRGGWYVARSARRYTLSRHWPARFDIAAQAEFPPLDPARLARQIRQDLWRRLQRLRGFAPAVEIDIRPAGLCVTAGGSLATRGAVPGGTADRIAALLADQANRARWIRWARIRGQA